MSPDHLRLTEEGRPACIGILTRLKQAAQGTPPGTLSPEDITVARRRFLLADLTHKSITLSLEDIHALLVRYLVQPDVQTAIMSGRQPATPSVQRERVLFLVAKQTEIIAARAVLGVQEVEPIFVENYPTWLVPAEAADQREIVLSMIGDQGPETASNACQTLIPRFEVGQAALCGMTAGMRERTNLGDVLCAKTVINPEGARLEPGIRLPRHRNYTVPDADWRKMAFFLSERERWWAGLSDSLVRLANDVPQGIDPSWAPMAREVVALSRPLLLADGSLPETRLTIDERVRASEMEAAGFCSACESRGVRWWVFKGVSDFGDPESKDVPDVPESQRKAWQFPATAASVVFARNFFTRVYRKG